MKNSGIIRNIDSLGRMSIPISFRRSLHIEPGDSLEIHLDEDCIILRKYTEKSCIFCGATEDLQKFKGKDVCASCLRELKL